ncbi:glycyl-radical enzyme activating protein [Promethearchaeum syntrophicum]|uniref:Glycyl-radical enzyme activating protein n=1 Tax=Promethearchaeum syntrophicum TaxID=2594042 RepID=A0A5B9DDN1_9ARCH|nr:glycyl-radical enzyme activating protein [Candidatus Prometheoarchaeum syntrophicum]QEE16873.1 Ketoisovalerate oxidoreductase subunit VorD [Candidatus Prometheoarchaeum syntrophicum]
MAKSISGNIFEIQRMSTEDGPGLRTTVFFKKCNLKCAWCHNPESFFPEPSIQWFSIRCIGCGTCVKICPDTAIQLKDDGISINRQLCSQCGLCVENCPTTALRKLGKEISLDDLLRIVEKDAAYYLNSKDGGITVSGGESALQAEFVSKFLQKCKEKGFHTALDTCGFVSKKNLEKIIPYVDLILYDLKEMDPSKHKEFTGQSNEIILENALWILNKIERTNKKMWVRTPIIPEFTASNENIHEIGRFIFEKLENKIDRWDLLAFNNLAKDKYHRMDLPYPCENLELFTSKEMEIFLQIAESTGVKNVSWTGLTRK